MTRHRQLLLGILGLLPCLACFSPSEGDRTSSGTCPAGEVCSTTTSGLFFTGTFDAGDGTLHVGSVVVGGTETVHLLAGADLASATPFTSAVTVVSDTPDVLAIDTSGGGAVTIRGVTEGAAFVRVLEADTGHLVDRVQVIVLAMQGPDLAVTELDDLMNDATLFRGHYVGPFAMLAGTHASVGVSLDGGVTDCGTDTALRVTDAAGATLVSGAASAPYRFTLEAARTPIALTVHAAGADTHLTVPVAAAVDAVQISQRDVVDQDGTRGTRVCAVGTAAGAPLVGAAHPSFDVDGTARAADSTHCLTLRASSGATSITAHVGSLSASASVTAR